MTLSRLIAVVSSPVHTEQTARIRTVGADRMHHTQSGAALFGAAFCAAVLPRSQPIESASVRLC